MKRFTAFVTGTDTEVGKTVITAGLLKAFEQQGFSTLGLKPVSAGCDVTDDGLRNEDALLLQKAASVKAAYETVNPVAYEPAIAPHIAAMENGKLLTASGLEGFIRGAMLKPAQVKLIEGAGGWFTPLSYQETLADLVKRLNVPVILVVGMRLGCLNHALLTVAALQTSGLTLAGWVANRVDPEMGRFDENLETLKQMVDAPCLGVVPHLEQASCDQVAQYLDVTPIISGR
ncbi:dethiobiotin synthase [Litoribrevibacter albus]|uniref:ATP-dependent dethiobiotin synthetase BioD n=1 Tax=Litoribrevibacter albus TaxID=1473156 RepID=A0AA37SBT2_9GAMM|nr:dethiobiotin synthase [Litoribrevibacter albus]GLQ33277.1 ATP-dependent dethiobiotin synthetase BioD [Litoribrevibacter albus]